MKPQPLRSYAGRFVVPLVLLGAAVACWIGADRLGTVDRAAAKPQDHTELAAPLASVRRLPNFAVGSSQTTALAAVLGALPPEPGGLSCASVMVDGAPVLEIRSNVALVPSYAQLLVTGHAAMDILGADFRYETAVLANALPDDNGRISGGIYLIGGGDPVFMSRNYAMSFRPPQSAHTSVEELATAVAAVGVVRIDGGVIGVDRRYDDQRTLPGWPDQYSIDGLVGPLTALQLDDAFATRPLANQGVAVPSDSPTVFAAERFVDELARVGVDATGFHRALFPEEDLPSLVPIAAVSSPPLADIIFQMLAVNDASAAELIVKELGVAASSTGSSQAGGRAIQTVLQQQGVDVPVPFRGGSGLDPIGGTSCSQLVSIADTIPEGHPTLTVLPAYNLPAVFGGRFRETRVESDLRLVGGIQGDSSGFVARTVESADVPIESSAYPANDPVDRHRITIASIINRPGGPNARDLAYQQALIEMVDALQASITVGVLSLDGPGD